MSDYLSSQAYDLPQHVTAAVASRLISLGAAFRDTLTVVMPEK